MAAGILLLLAAPALAAPVVTKAKIRLTRKGDVRLSVRGTLAEIDWGSPQQVVVRAGSHSEILSIDSFSSSRKGRKLRYRGERTAVVKKAVFDLVRGRFLLKCRSSTAGDYANPLPLSVELPLRWDFDLPIDPEKKTTRFRGEVPGTSETQASALVAQLPNGTQVVLVVTAWDDRSREMDVVVEYSVDGGASWKPATQTAGEEPPSGIAATPEGTEVGYTWEAYEDLGCGLFPGALVRATPVEPAGSAGASAPFELLTYGESEVVSLAADLYADLRVDGILDDTGVIDARSAANFDVGRIPGAIHVLLETILADGADAIPFPKDRRIVFYCYGGTT
ncbi:MAG: rhodanese-like domain-containing protein [Planctomycetota bacterium]|jgi:hypothetical protein